ncbi:MAG TPA: NHLP-related RiPP peptide [Rudaea sp.]|jgi:putative modified peptide|nr:NHLP-related RiPP peptide [Rudaea sp.]
MANSKLGSDVVDRLLDKLSTDDQFRSDFQNNPRAALNSVGGSDAECGECMQTKNLASKAQFQQSRQVFRDSLLGESSQRIFSLEAK